MKDLNPGSILSRISQLEAQLDVVATAAVIAVKL